MAVEEPMLITSRQNRKVKAYQGYLTSAGKRNRDGVFVLEGARLCRDAALSGVELLEVFVTEEAMERYRGHMEVIHGSAAQIYVVAAHVAEAMTDTKHTQGIFAVCRMQTVHQMEAHAGRMLALENIQDPANLGAMLRTAEALGLSGVCLTDSCCDLYAPKTLRASMGAVFRMRCETYAGTEDLLRVLHSQAIETYAAVPDRSARHITAECFPENAVVFIGNEGNGLKQTTIASCCQQITIPMGGRAESLNAAAAAAIIMWELTRPA